jgi:zinc protease
MEFMKSNWHRRFYCLLIFTLSFCFVAVLATAADRAETDAKNEPGVPKYTSVRCLGDDVTLAALSNGLTVIVQENHVAPVATVRCFVKNTGSIYEGKNLGSGISHVLEHVVAGGSTFRRTEKEITKIVDSFGGATNAFTSNDMTVFFIDCPARETMTAIDLVADSMQHVKFEPAEFQRELKVVRRELADDEVDRKHVLWDMLDRTVYMVNPARYPVIGYLDVLNQTTNQTIMDFYHDRYVPNNQVFVVVGDIKTDEVLEQVAKQYAGTPRGKETYIALADEPEQLTPRRAVREMDGATCDMVLAWPTVKLSHPDMYALDVAAYIIGEGESSRLVRGLKYDRQLVLSIGTASQTPDYVQGYFAVTAVCRPQEQAKAAEEIRREVYRLREELVAPAELERAKKQKAVEMVLSRQTVQEAALSLGRDFLSAGDPQFEKVYVENIQKVTAEQIRDAARRYFLPQRLNQAVIFPPGAAPPEAEKKAGGGTGEIKSIRLPNGLRVLIKRHSHLPLVNIQAAALCGSLADSEDSAGRAALVAAMLDQGTADHSARQIAEYFDSIGASFGAEAGRCTIFAGLTAMREDFPQAAALFAECFIRPVFPREEFKKNQTLALGAIARRADNPQAQIAEFFYDSLPAKSLYHVLSGGKTETVKRLTAQNLQEYHARYFVPENMIVTVFGDIDPDEASATVARLFGQLKPDPKFEKLSFVGDNSIPKTLVLHKQIDKPTGMIWLGYSAPSIFDKEDHAAMTLLNAITAGYYYPGGWLHTELRGEGLVYYVQASQITGPVAGYFTVLAQTMPEKLPEVVKRILKNIEKAKAGKIDEDEFRVAVDRVTALHAQENTTIAAQAKLAALYELYGLGYDYDKTFDARIKAVKLEDVVRVARKYLGNYILTTMSPDEKEKNK